MIQGVPREINNIVTIFVIAILGFLAWKRPLLGGILLAVFAILITIYFLTFNDNFSTALVGMVLLERSGSYCRISFYRVGLDLEKKDVVGFSRGENDRPKLDWYPK